MGRRTVEVGRWREFDAGFMPTRASAGRWKRVDHSYRMGRGLPPVALYKLGDDYYVVDGNHRVSVARCEGGRDNRRRRHRVLPLTNDPPEDGGIA
jgi:hypothetical protein